MSDETRIRRFEPDDTDEVVRLWNETLEREKADAPWYVRAIALSPDRLAEIRSDPNFDPEAAFVASNAGAVVGFARGAVKTARSFPEEDLGPLPGFLEALLVDPAQRNRGVGGRLLAEVESYVRRRGKTEIKCTRFRSAVRGAWVLAGTIEEGFLRKRGFTTRTGPEIALRLDLAAFEPRREAVEARERLAREGIEIRYYEKKDYAALEALMAEHFGHWWYFNWRPNLKTERPARVLVAAEGPRVVGFVGLVWVDADRRAGFSPGVDPGYRRRGIGNALTNAWAVEVKKLGALESVISTGAENLAAQHIYFGMGFTEIGRYRATMTKRLDC